MTIVRRHLALPALSTLAPLCLYLYLRSHPAVDPVLAAPVRHFYIVSAVAFLAAVVTVAIGLAGIRLRNLQVVFLAMAFSSLSLIFMLHGLSTPHLLMHPSRVPGVAAQLSILVTAFWLLMSALPSDLPLAKALARYQRGLVPLWCLLLVALLAATMLRPALVAWLPIDEAPLRWLVATLTMAMFAGAAYRYLQSYAYSRSPLQIALVHICGWLALAQVIMISSELWRLSWWLYHLLLLAAVLLLLVGLYQQYASGNSLALALRGLLASDPEERLAAGISPSIRALVVATEARDRYTAGHSHRVALHAVQLGEALGLAPELLRALAQGAMVHDIGKIETPDEALNKPGRLTSAERAVIERHPVTGFEMCRRLGFMTPELEVIRSHHERWDGEGYPDGLAGEEIPLLARILAVADVYDALTSDRSYRAAWGFEQARRYIEDGAGSQFDPACVEAWLKLTETGPLEAAERVPRARAGLRTSQAAS